MIGNEYDIPLPDYDGGPRDQMRGAAREMQERIARRDAEDRALSIDNLWAIIRKITSSNDEVCKRAANVIYDEGYRKVK